MVLMSGGIPKELTAEDFSFLNAKITLIYGTEDEYMDETRMQYEQQRVHELFGNAVTIIPFEGEHIVNVELINALV
jgi:predicted esterase